MTEKIQVGSSFIVNFKLDTGSEANILPVQMYNKLRIKPKLHQSNKFLLVYNKQRLNIRGVCEITLKHKNLERQFDFYILKDNYEPIVGYMFNRLPYELTNAAEIFQKYTNDLICNLDGTVAYMDDILVFGNSLEEHNWRLAKLLDKARKAL